MSSSPPREQFNVHILILYRHTREVIGLLVLRFTTDCEQFHRAGTSVQISSRFQNKHDSKHIVC